MQRAGLMQGLQVPNMNTETWRSVMYDLLLEKYCETGGVPAFATELYRHFHDFIFLLTSCFSCGW